MNPAGDLTVLVPTSVKVESPVVSLSLTRECEINEVNHVFNRSPLCMRHNESCRRFDAFS